MSDFIEKDTTNDGIDRRGFLKCMAWAGAGVVWAMNSGILTARAFGADASTLSNADFTFVQVSDSHVGFNKGVYTDVLGTFQTAVSRINALGWRATIPLREGLQRMYADFVAHYDAIRAKTMEGWAHGGHKGLINRKK